MTKLSVKIKRKVKIIMGNDFDSFSVCFNIMKLKYMQLSETLGRLNFLYPDSKVNVFINMESVLKSLSMIKDIDRKIYSSRDFNEIMISNIVNLAAHYRKFFRGNNLDTRVYLYMTELEEPEYNETELNPDFRSYYYVKYTKNPKYLDMTDRLNNIIIPKSKEIMNYIKGVYFLTSKNFDSSLIPLMIARKEPDRKNIVITSEYVDTQYSLYENFICYYLRRSPIKSTTSCNIQEHVVSLLNKTDNEYSNEFTLYSNKAFYVLLFSMIGEQYRTVEKIPGVGSATLIKYLLQGINDKKITNNVFNIDTIVEVLPEHMKAQVIENFNCLDFETMIRRVTLTQLNYITNQLIDRFDHNGLMQINSTIFYNHRLMLEELTL